MGERLPLATQVWTWGEPWGDFSMKVDRSPRRVEGATDIVKLACGAFHNLALNACAPCAAPAWAHLRTAACRSLRAPEHPGARFST